MHYLAYECDAHIGRVDSISLVIIDLYSTAPVNVYKSNVNETESGCNINAARHKRYTFWIRIWTHLRTQARKDLIVIFLCYFLETKRKKYLDYITTSVTFNILPGKNHICNLIFSILFLKFWLVKICLTAFTIGVKEKIKWEMKNLKGEWKLIKYYILIKWYGFLRG